MPQLLTRHKWLWIVAAAFVALFIFAACDDDDDGDGVTPADGETPVVSTEPLKIGVLLPFTGDLSNFTPTIAQSIQLAADQINAAGGVLGQPIEIVTADTATDASTGATEATRLIEVEGVQAIIGALSSGTTVSVAESVTVPNEILMISPASTAATLTTVADNDYLFRVVVSDETQGVALAFLVDDLGIGSICTMFINNDYGQGLSGLFSELFGGTVTAEVPHESAQTTYASELDACTEGGPDALAAIAYPESAGVFLREAVEGEVAPTYIFVDGTKNPEMFADLGWPDAFDGMFGTAPGGATPAGDSFEAAFEAEFGEPPGAGVYEAQGSDAVYAIALAAQKAGSTDSTAIRDALRDVANPPGEIILPSSDGWTQALDLLAAGQDINYEGAGGSVDLDDNGDVLGDIEVWQVDTTAQELVTVRLLAVDLATGEVTELE